MNTLNGYSKSTLTDKYVLTASGGHRPLADSEFIVGTQTAATGSWTGVSIDSELYDGKQISYWLPYDGSGNATLNLTLAGGSTTGAVNCYYGGTSRLTTHYGAGNIIRLVYRKNVNISGATYTGWWADANYTDGNTYTSAWCGTAAATAAKTATCSNYTLRANSYIHVLIRYTNTAASALTLNINSTGAKPIYINGVASSEDNYSLYSGTYIVFFNGTNYYFNTDGSLPGNIKDSSILWGTDSIRGDISPIDSAASYLHSGNKLLFAKPGGITIEYSTNGGSTWVDYGATEANKIGLVSGLYNKEYIIGKGLSTKALESDLLRITLHATNMGVYTRAKSLLIDLTTSGSNNCKVKVEIATKGSPSSFSTRGEYPVEGWSGWNRIPLNNMTFGGMTGLTSHIEIIRLTFTTTGTTKETGGHLTILSLLLLGVTNWITPSNMAKTGHLYSWDSGLNAIFPAQVTATLFNGPLNGNASSATKLQTKRKLWGLEFDGTADVNGDITINAANTDKYITFTSSTFGADDINSWRLGYLGTGSGNNNYFVLQSTKTTSNTWTSALTIANETLQATFGGTVVASTFQGNLDGTYVNALTDYAIATTVGSISETDSLNTALGKLEFKTDFIYNDLFGTDNDEYINKWSEIVDFIDSVKEGTDILDEFVTRKTDLTITGQKNFNTNTNSAPLVLSRNGLNTKECVSIGVDDGTVVFNHIQDEKTANYTFKGTWLDTDNSDGSKAGNHAVYFNLGNSDASIKLDTYTVYHTGNLTKLSQLTNDCNFVTGGPYLPLAGGVMNNGAKITFNANGGIEQTTATTSNATRLVQWYKGASKDPDYTNAATIGWHNMGDTDGAIYLVPHPSNTDPWAGSVGLYIGKNTLKWNNNNLLHSGNSSVSGGGSTWGSSITVNINGTTKTLTIPAKPTIPTVTDYYWANIKVSETESTTTTPTFGSTVTLNSTGNVILNLTRTSLSSWRFLNDKNLTIQNNYTTAVVDYFDVVKIAYNTGNVTLKGSLTASSSSDTVGIPLVLKNTGWKGGMSTAMDFYNGSNYTVPNARIETKMNGDGRAGGTLIFYTLTAHATTNPNPNGLTERLRIGDNGIITIAKQIERSSGSSWIKARDNAVVRQICTTSSTYLPVVSMKTASGSWSMGTLGSSEKLIVSYDTDENYNANTNSNTAIYFPTSAGTLALVSDITKSQVGLGNVQNTAFYQRVTTVNGTPWNMAGTTNSAAFTIYAPTTAGTSGLVLTSTAGTPSWTNQSSLSVGSAAIANRLALNGIADSTTYGTYAGIIQTNTGGPESESWHNSLKILHNNSSGYYTQLAQNFTGTHGLWHRSNRAGTISRWYKVIDDLGGTIYGGLSLLSDSGDSPHLVFQRGTTTDGTYDWDMYVTGGYFKMRYNNAGTWSEILSLYPGSNLLEGYQILTAGNWSSYITLPTIPSISITNSGSGNAVTSITASGHTLTVTKGSTFATSGHTHYYLTTPGDKRSEATTPSSYSNTFVFLGLKNNSAIDSPSSVTYSYLLGLRGWSDSSGGNSWELAFNNKGIYARNGASTWGSWGKIAFISDIPTKTSQLTNDSNFITSRGYIGTTPVLDSLAAQSLSGIINITATGNYTSAVNTATSLYLKLANKDTAIGLRADSGTVRGVYDYGKSKWLVYSDGTDGAVLLGHVATSSTWSKSSGGTGAGIKILNAIGSSPTGALSSYSIGLEVSGYYSLLLASKAGVDDTLYFKGALSTGWVEILHKNNLGNTAILYDGDIDTTITYLGRAGYGYAAKGWKNSGPAIAIGSSNGYTALIQQLAGNPTLYVSYKSNGGAVQAWNLIAFISDLTWDNITGKPTIPSLSLGTTTGSGNAVTSISVSGHTITLNKGTTFLTSHQSLANCLRSTAWINNPGQDADNMTNNTMNFTYANNAPNTGPIIYFAGASGGSYGILLNAAYYAGKHISFRVRNGDSGTWNPWYRLATADEIPTNTSQLTNDSGFITSRGYIGTTSVQASSGNLALTGINNITTPSLGFTITTPSGNIQIGPQNTSGCHIYTNRDLFYFNKPIYYWNGSSSYVYISEYNYTSYTPILNSSSTHATKSSVIYAPTTSGSGGDLLISDGLGSAPVWTSPGNVTVGGASKADKLTVARTISLSGAVTGSASFDGSANITIATSVNHTHSYLPLAGGTMSTASSAIAWPTGSTDATSVPIGITVWSAWGTNKCDAPSEYEVILNVKSDYTMLIACTAGGTGTLRYRNSTSNSWVKILDENNYTSYTPILNSSSTHATKSSVIYAPTSAGTSGYVLKSNGSGAPSWIDPSSLSVSYAEQAGSATTAGTAHGLSKSFAVFGVAFNGAIDTTVDMSTLIGVMGAGDSNITDSTHILTSHVNGFNSSGNTTTIYKRTANYLWNYIKGKIDSTYTHGASGGYIGTTAVQSTSQTQNLTGIGGITANSTIQTTGSLKGLYVYVNSIYGNTSTGMLISATSSIDLSAGNNALIYISNDMRAIYTTRTTPASLGLSNAPWGALYAASGTFTGNISANGGSFYTNANGAYWTSDMRFKTNITKARNLDIADLLVEFDWKESNEHSWGYIAQELLEVLPEAVSYNTDTDRYAVNYNVAHSAAIASLTARIKELEEKLKKYGIW